VWPGGAALTPRAAGSLPAVIAAILALTENQALSRPYPYWMFLLEGVHYVNRKIIQGYGRNLANPQSTYHGSYAYCDLLADSPRHFQTGRESRFSQCCAEVE
jgi:hypothetical protein